MTTSTRRALGTTVASLALLLGSAGVAAGHGQTVQPPPHDEPVVSGPISNAWAQAHCNAASPGLVAEASKGVMTFTPAGALPCPAVPNPGGQVHPGAE